MPPAASRLSRAKALPAALDFSQLRTKGIETAQRYSGDIWTDFNDHDPGLTILEALCYALTDIGYRTSHPMADLLSSSSASAGVPTREQPLFTGDKILVTAPVTKADVRALVVGKVQNVRNLWLLPLDGKPNHFDVLIDIHPRSKTGALTEAEINSQARAALIDATKILQSNRPLGVAFETIRPIGYTYAPLIAQVNILPHVSAETLAANIIFAVEELCDPLPKISSFETMMKAGNDPASVFDGPPSVIGHIDTRNFRALRASIPEESLLSAIQQVAGVQSVAGLSFDSGVRTKVSASELTLPMPSRAVVDLSRLQFHRNGVPVPFDAEKVVRALQNFDSEQRWASLYERNSVKTLPYATIPQGNANRQLDRYRSIQHLFPQIYGLGEFGLQKSPKPASIAHQAAIRQLKGYLFLFEQLLADQLGQLDHIAEFFSFKASDASYFSQPIASAKPNPDNPPHVDQILGSGKDNDWHAHYVRDLSNLNSHNDPYRDRNDRALDHMLARFGEVFDNDVLWLRLRAAGITKEHADDTRIRLKRAFLSHCVTLGRDRGLGPDLTDYKETALQTRVRLKSGYTERCLIIEHATLASGSYQLDEVQAFRVRAGKVSLLAVLRDPIQTHQWPQTRDAIAEALRNGADFAASTMPDYTVALSCSAANHPQFFFVERFGSFAEINWAKKLLTTDRLTIERQLFPTPFFDGQLSAFFETPAKAGHADIRSLTERTLSDCLPAHLTSSIFWLPKKAYATLGQAHKTWLNGGMADPRAMIQLINRNACAAFLAELDQFPADSPK